MGLLSEIRLPRLVNQKTFLCKFYSLKSNLLFIAVGLILIFVVYEYIQNDTLNKGIRVNTRIVFKDLIENLRLTKGDKVLNNPNARKTTSNLQSNTAKNAISSETIYNNLESNSSLIKSKTLTNSILSRIPSVDLITTTTKPPPSLSLKKLSPRCEEIRRRVSWGAVDYAQWDGDPELQQLVLPMFKKKRLVVWSLDDHHGPISDLRSIIEPLGVEFIEHTIYHYGCHQMCTCDDEFKGMTPFDRNLIWQPDHRLFDHVYRDSIAAVDIGRTDAFLTASAFPLTELFIRYNRSIIAVSPIRYNYMLKTDMVNRWRLLNERLRFLMSQQRNVFGGNCLYEVEYSHYFTGVRPDYVPGFSVYTGEHWHPTRHSFLVHRSRRLGIPGDFWDAINSQSRKLNATFKLEELRMRYPQNFEFTDLASHLGIVHLPHQVSTMSFYEHYSMCIPIFAPSLGFLTRLHLQHKFVCDKNVIGMGSRQRESDIPVHPNYDGYARVPQNENETLPYGNKTKFISLDPNNDYDERSVRVWLSFADWATLPQIVHFESYDQVAEILHAMWTYPARLQAVHDGMRAANRERLKYLLRYWRKRLRDIADHSPFKPE